MADLFPVAGMKFYIGAAPMATQAADFVAGDFAGVTWVEVDGWSQMGSIGDAAALITTPLINRGRDQKTKGTANAGSMANVFGIIRDDAGQLAIRAAGAASNKNNYPFRILGNDPTGSPATATKIMFVGIVMSAQEAGGEANTNQMLNATVEINSNLVEVSAGE